MAGQKVVSHRQWIQAVSREGGKAEEGKNEEDVTLTFLPKIGFLSLFRVFIRGLRAFAFAFGCG